MPTLVDALSHPGVSATTERLRTGYAGRATVASFDLIDLIVAGFDVDLLRFVLDAVPWRGPDGWAIFKRLERLSSLPPMRDIDADDALGWVLTAAALAEAGLSPSLGRDGLDRIVHHARPWAPVLPGQGWLHLVAGVSVEEYETSGRVTDEDALRALAALRGFPILPVRPTA